MMAKQEGILGVIMRVPGVRHAAAVTADGFVTEKSDRLDAEVADRLAAHCAAFSSLSKSLAEDHSHSGASPRGVTVELGDALVFIRSVSSGVCVAVVTDITFDADLLTQALREVIRVTRAAM